MQLNCLLTAVWLQVSTINRHTSVCQVEEEGGSPRYSYSGIRGASVARQLPSSITLLVPLFQHCGDVGVSLRIMSLPFIP